MTILRIEMIEITRDEFLNFALIPDIAHAKEVNWFKSNKMADKLGIIIQIDSNKNMIILFIKKIRQKTTFFTLMMMISPQMITKKSIVN